MCDYSLLAIPNRLAVEGEPLVVHRFQTGAMGLAPAAEIAASATELHVPTRREGWWSALQHYFTPNPAKVVYAVCIPPGARLLLRDIPERLQREYQVGEAEGVIFTQISATEYHYRDAVRFANSQEVLLQRLEEGQRLEVLCLSAAEELPQVRAAHMAVRGFGVSGWDGSDSTCEREECQQTRIGRVKATARNRGSFASCQCDQQ